MTPEAPAFKLIYKGVDIADAIMPHLISCTYTDKLSGESDEIEVTVHDKDGLWRGPWCPEHGDKAELWIAADKAGPFVPCGAFEIDEPEAKIARSGDTFNFKGVAAPISKSLRTSKTKAYENQSLKQIAEKVAGEHGLSVQGTPPEVQFERQTQRRERPLEFLARLADSYGAYFAVRGDKVIFTRRQDVHGRAPVLTVETSHPRLISADLKRGSHKTYSKAKGTYYDGKKKKTIEVEVEDKKVANGDTLRIDDRTENEGQAKARASSELEKQNLKKQTGTLEFVAMPLLVAGQTLMLGASFGKWAGKYVVQESKHTLTRKGYTTEVEIASV